jgi:peptidoglycan/LPS O-acetylase OafA/YrhL
MTTQATSQHRFDLDWLRVFGILAVFIFHSSRFFDLGGWHVKNPTTYLGVEMWIAFLASWLMPLMFIISGASVFYALRAHNTGKFIKDKVLRLLVPLVVGIFTHSIWQIYLENITQGRFSGTFFEFLPHYFDGLYGFGGNFAWMGVHLWYLEVLFVLCLALLPLFRWLKIGGGQRVLDRAGSFLAKPGAIYLLVLPIALLRTALDPDTFFGSGDFGGWGLPIYIVFFVYGFIVISHDGVQQRIQELRRVSLVSGILILAALIALYAAWGETSFGTLEYVVVNSAYALLSWCWLLAILGFGMKHFNTSSARLPYANEAVLPFYILHQPVLLSIGYFIVPLPIPDLLKWLIIASTSFVTIMALYEFVIRRVNVLRFLFGMKPLRRSVQPAPTAVPQTGEITTY